VNGDCDVVDPPLPMLPSEQFTIVPAVLNAHAGAGVTLIGMMPSGRVAVSATFVAVSGPPLVIVAV
jgi:hypothetical protein